MKHFTFPVQSVLLGFEPRKTTGFAKPGSEKAVKVSAISHCAFALSEPDFVSPVSHTRPVLRSSVTVDRAADANETFRVPRAKRLTRLRASQDDRACKTRL